MKNLLIKMSAKTKNVAIATGVTVGSIVSTIPVFADGLDPAITAGFTSAATTTALVIGAGVAASVGVIALSGGAKAGLRWIKGVFAKAA